MTTRTSIAKDLDRLVAVGEAYPELRSDKVYATLQTQLSDENEHLAAARRSFNASVSEYNQLIVSFPASIVAGNMGATQEEFYEAPEGANLSGDVEL